MTLIVLLIVAALLYLAELYLYRHLWSKGLSASVSFQKDAVTEGDTAELYEVVVNKKLLPLPILNVKFQFHRNLSFSLMENTNVSDNCYRNDIFSLLSNQKITRTLSIRCSKRGFYTITQMDLVATDLLMTSHLLMHTSQYTQLYVYPALIDDRRLEVPFRKIMGVITSRQFIYPDPFEFKGIRNYEPTDPLNSINWKASARTGSLMVNTYDSTSSQEVVLLLDLADETIWREDDLHEESIRLASSLAARFLNAGIPVRMVCNGRDIVTGEVVQIPAGSGNQQLSEINQCLARIDLSAECAPFTSYLEQEAVKQELSVPLYILISLCQNKLLTSAQTLAASHSGIFWILPLHRNASPQISSDQRLEVIPWQTKY